jgi:hypothetical protein
MDRKRFLDLCQKYAVLSPHIKSDSGIDIPGDLLVSCDGFLYYPVAYKLMFNPDGSVMHIAVLKERNANCIREVELGKVAKNGD